MFYPCLRIDPIFVVFSNCKNQANLMDIIDCRLQIVEGIGHRASFDKLPATSSGQAGQVGHRVRREREELATDTHRQEQT